MNYKTRLLVGTKKIQVWSKQDYQKWLSDCRKLVSTYRKEMIEAWDALEELEKMLINYPQNAQYHDAIEDFKSGSDGIQEMITNFESFTLGNAIDILDLVEEDIKEME